MQTGPVPYDEPKRYDDRGYDQTNPPPYAIQAQYPTQAPYPEQHQPNISYPPYPQGQSYNVDAVPYQAQSDYVGNDNYDSEFTSFSDKSIRQAFIRKVYMIMTAQLLVTCAFIGVLQFVQPIQRWVHANLWFYILAYITFIVTYIALVCCPSVRRKYPGNFICLSVFTVAFSFMVGVIASFHDTPAVMAAAGITTIVCLAISIFAIQTKIDFTLCSGIILVVSLVFLLTGLTCVIINATMGSSKVVQGVYAGIGILLFSLYLIYDTQMIVGGRRFELSPEDYIEGALQLYLDVVNMFLLILSLFGSKN